MGDFAGLSIDPNAVDPAGENAELDQFTKAIIKNMLLNELQGQDVYEYRQRGASARAGVVDFADYLLGGFIGDIAGSKNKTGLLSTLFYDNKEGAPSLGAQLFGEKPKQDKAFILQLVRALSANTETSRKAQSYKPRPLISPELSEQKGAVDRIFDKVSRGAEAGDAVSLPLFKNNKLRMDGARFVEAWAVGREDLPQDVANDYESWLSDAAAEFLTANPEATPNDLSNYLTTSVEEIHGDGLTRINEVEDETGEPLDDATYGRLKQVMSVQSNRLLNMSQSVANKIYRNSQTEKSIRLAEDLITNQAYKRVRMPQPGGISAMSDRFGSTYMGTVVADPNLVANQTLYYQLKKSIEPPALTDSEQAWEKYKNKLANAAETSGVMQYQIDANAAVAEQEAAKLAADANSGKGSNSGAVPSAQTLAQRMEDMQGPGLVKGPQTLTEYLMQPGTSIDELERLNSIPGTGPVYSQVPPYYGAPVQGPKTFDEYFSGLSLDEVDKFTRGETGPYYAGYTENQISPSDIPQQSMTADMPAFTVADTQPGVTQTAPQATVDAGVELAEADLQAKTAEKQAKYKDFLERGKTYDAEKIEEIEFAIDSAKEQKEKELAREGTTGIFKAIVEDRWNSRIADLESDLKYTRGKKNKLPAKEESPRTKLLRQLDEDQKFYDRAVQNLANLRQAMDEAINITRFKRQPLTDLEKQRRELEEQYYFLPALKMRIDAGREKLTELENQ